MSGQFAIKTPFKLKRDAPTTISTIDRTILAPKSALPPPPARQTVRIPSLTQFVPAMVRSSLPSDTAELQREMGRLMGKDEQLSQRSNVHTKSGHSYTLRPLQSRLVLSQPHPIPSRVRHLYEQQAGKDSGHCEFKQGLLPTACVYYFAVGQWVLFYDIGRAVQLGGRLEEGFMHQCQFESAVVEVRELAVKHPIFGEFKNRSILLVVLPWKLAFAALELQGGDRLQAGPRWMRLTLLNTSLTIAAQQPSHFTEDPVDHRLYYLDEEGGINCVAFESNNWLGKLMGNNSRYRLSQATAPSAINSKAFFVSRRATIWERLRHYSRVILAQATSFYGKLTKNYDLVCDGRRRLLFSLVDTNHDPQESKPSPYKLLTAWDTGSDKLTVKCQISEAELYEREIVGIANFSVLANYRIVRLAAISPCIDVEAALMVVLECGIRLYLSVDDCFRVVRHLLPPLLESTAFQQRQPMEHHRGVELTHCCLDGNSTVLNLKEEGDNRTFVIWRMNEENQEEEFAEITWGSNMASPSGNAPLQNQMHRMQLSLGPQKKQQILKELSSRCTKNPFSGANALPHLHQLARDLLLPPTPYLHSTDSDLLWMCEVRPIDWTFSAVMANMRDERIFRRVLEGLPLQELLFLLVQLFCDPEGLYLKDLQLIDCLANYERRLLQQGGLSFDSFHNEFRARATRTPSRKQREIQPTYVGRGSIDAQMEERLLDLLFRLAKQSEGKPKRETQVQQAISNGIMLYLSRLLRFLWRRSVRKVNSKLDALLPMIQPIMRIVQHCRSPPTKPKIIPQQPEFKLENLVPTRKSKEVGETSVPETEPLEVVGRLVGRISQLLTLCSKVELRVEKTFAEALSMSSEQFQGPLFRFLTDKYDHPVAALQIFKQAFPCFVGDQLQRSLRIEQESRGKEENEIVAILRYHKGVPSYLLRHLQSLGKIHPDSSRSIQSLSSVVPSSKLSISSCNVRDGVGVLMRQLKEGKATLQDRALTVLQLNALLAHHLQTHQQEDRFYRDSRTELQQVERRLTMQQLLITQYEERGEANVQVVSELKTSLFEVEVLGELVELLKVPRLKIIFALMFVRLEQEETLWRLQQDFTPILEMDRRGSEEREDGLLRKTHKFIQDKLRIKTPSDSSRWPQLQITINSIVSSTRTCLPLEQLLPILTTSILGQSAASPNISQQEIENSLPVVSELLRGKDRFAMRQEVHRLPFPVLSAMLRRAGCDEGDLQSIYEGWLRKQSENGAVFDCKESLYRWIDLLLLSLEIEPRGEFFLFNSKRFFDNFTRNFPDKRTLLPQLRLLCKNYAILHRLEALHSQLFPE